MRLSSSPISLPDGRCRRLPKEEEKAERDASAEEPKPKKKSLEDAVNRAKAKEGEEPKKLPTFLFRSNQ